MEWKTTGHAHVLGDDILHDGGVIRFDFVTGRVTDPEILIPQLFAEIDPTLIQRIKPGDFIVAGRNFLAGKAHNNGLIAMKALGLRILCESMPFRSFRAVTALALPAMTQCAGVRDLVADGDEIEADFATGLVKNLSRGTEGQFTPVARDIQVMLEEGGMRGMLAAHLSRHPELAVPR
jgi:3-isopropylmalate/(R)-2-methylmalate dehydratase small subunit